MSVTQKTDGRWAVVYYENGRQRWKYFGRGVEAEAAARQFDAELKKSGSIGPYKKRSAVFSPRLDELAEAYMESKNATLPRASQRNLIYKLSSVILPALGHIQAMRLSDRALDRYVQDRLIQVKRTTVHRELSDVQAILNWAVRRKLISFNPVAGYQKPSRDDEIIPPPTPAEIQKIIRHSAEHLKRAIYVSYFTGLRPGESELYQLKWQDVDFDGRVIFIRSAQKGGPRARSVPIHEKFFKKLWRWHQSDLKSARNGQVKSDSAGHIIHYKGKPVASVKKAFAAAKRRAGIARRIRLYDLRHAFATAMLAAGGDLKSTSELLGHSRPDTTVKIYQHSNLTLHRSNVNKLPDIPD
jgi:integrase